MRFGQRALMTPVPDTAPTRPRVVVAGEFSSGKSSLINLLLRQPVLDLSVGWSVHPPIRLRHGAERMIMAHHWDGSVRQTNGVSEATTNPEVAEVELSHPLTQFPGVEIVELPPPNGASFPEPQRTMAADADLLIWCTIGSQAWRLTEKDAIAALGRGHDRPSILAVMRNDLIRSDEDRAKITRRLETEARPFFTDIQFVAGSTEAIDASADNAVWEASGGRIIASAVAELPGADVQPPVVTPSDAMPAGTDPAEDPETSVLLLTNPLPRAEPVAEPMAEPEADPTTAPQPDQLSAVDASILQFTRGQSAEPSNPVANAGSRTDEGLNETQPVPEGTDPAPDLGSTAQPEAEAAPQHEASIAPAPETSILRLTNPLPSAVKGSASLPANTPEPAPNPDPVPAALADSTSDEALEEKLDTLLGMIAEFPGYRHAAVVSRSGKVISHNTDEIGNSVEAARMLFQSHAGAEAGGEQVQEMILRGSDELHLLWDVGNGAHMHLLMNPKMTTINSVKATLRSVGLQGGDTHAKG